VSNADDVALAGGRQTSGIVRVGATVRRPVHARSNYVRAVLRHLESVGFDGAPRSLGVDDHGREVLTYIEGDVADGSPEIMPDQRLAGAAALIHDATAGTELAPGGEVVCHGDLGHHNTVFVADEAVALIDWDAALAPGSRLVDLAHAVWCYAAVGEPAIAADYQVHATQLICDTYGWDDRHAVIDEMPTGYAAPATTTSVRNAP
jgi:hypothetical protein